MNYKISSKANSTVKHAKKLLTSSPFRKKEKLFLLEGIRFCDEA